MYYLQATTNEGLRWPFLSNLCIIIVGNNKLVSGITYTYQVYKVQGHRMWVGREGGGEGGEATAGRGGRWVRTYTFCLYGLYVPD